MVENEANRANFEELIGHVQVLKARLESNIKQDAPASQSQYDDLFDYYERAVKDRVMRNATLTEELNETHAKLDQHKRRFEVLRLSVVLAIIIMVFVVGIMAFPSETKFVVASPYCTHFAMIVVGIGLSALFKRRRVKQD